MKTSEEKIAEIGELFDFILKYQDKFASQVATEQESRNGSGRKGILMIRGPNKFVKVLEVVDGRIRATNNTDNTRTVIVFENVDSFVTCIQEFLNGSSSAIARAKARGEVKIEGDYAMRDFIVFSDLFLKIGQVLNNYGVTIGG